MDHHWKVDVRLPEKGNSNSHGARPVHYIISMIKWIRTSRLSVKNSLSRPPRSWRPLQPESDQAPRWGSARLQLSGANLSSFVDACPEPVNCSSSLQDDATVKCWGWGISGQLGIEDTYTWGDDANGSCPPKSTTASVAPGFVSSLLLLLPACRDGGQPPFGRPGGWKDGRSRHRWRTRVVCPAGKATPGWMGVADLHHWAFGPHTRCERKADALS